VNFLLVLAAETEEPPNPVIPTENEIVWAAIFFVALWMLMKYVLLPPITRAMEARADTIQGDRDAADAATASLGSTRRDYEASLAEARADANEIIATARGNADTQRAALQAEADAEIADLRRDAQAEIDQARTDALDGMRGDIATLAVGAAGAVLGRNLDAGAQQSVIDQALAAD
jgi:F-type H+-transporting ATPase subunit b